MVALIKQDMEIPRKEREFLRREEDIIQAALSLFNHSAWENVTVAQIAAKAGIGKGTVYKHFTCKEDLYARISIDFNQQLLALFREIDLSASLAHIMRQMISTAFDVYLENPSHARVSHYCKRGDFVERIHPELQQQFTDLDGHFKTFIHSVLEIGIRQGDVPNLPPEQLVVGLEATFDGALFMIWNGQCSQLAGLTQNQFIELISEYMLAGLLGLKKRTTP